jgi:hypothetical protein
MPSEYIKYGPNRNPKTFQGAYDCVWRVRTIFLVPVKTEVLKTAYAVFIVDGYVLIGKTVLFQCELGFYKLPEFPVTYFEKVSKII